MVWSWECGVWRSQTVDVGVPREIPLGHTVYKPNIMSVCVSLKVRV